MNTTTWLFVLFALFGFIWWLTIYAENDVKSRYKHKRGKPPNAYLQTTKVIKPGVRLFFTSDVSERDVPSDMRRDTKLKF